MHSLLRRISPWMSSLLCSYALIIFSRRRLVGAFLLLATFNDPASGLTGIAGVILSLLFARLLGLAPDFWHQGFLSFNALLCSLGVAYLYTFTWQTAPIYLLLLGLMSFSSVLLTVSLHGIFRTYLALPILSIPFVILNLSLGLVTVFITGHPLTPPIRSILLSDPHGMPVMATVLLKSLGNLFFQDNVWAGLLISAALLIESRLSLMLAALGLCEGLWLLNIFTFGQGALHMGTAGFNCVLTSILLGGVLLIPGFASFLYAAFGVAVCVATSAALEVFFRGFNISPMAIPFNMAALLLLYALRFRTVLRAPFPVDFIPGSPEENLEYHLNRLQRLGQNSTIGMRLPFLGKWTVTQPPESKPTHQPPWQHAWDFEVTDGDGRTFRGAGDNPADYYSYDLPVMAPADGTVVQVVDNVSDNHIGEFNAQQNWGNLVMLWHGGGLYSLLCHLRPGSVKVKPQEIVKQGQLLGRCGNSGRSPFPHLHFHVQRLPQLNAPTCPSEFVRYTEETSGDGDLFHLSGIPRHNTKLQNFEGSDSLASLLQLQVGQKAHFQVSMGERRFFETWTIRIDLYSNLFIESDRGAKVYFYVTGGLFTAFSFSGSHQSALHTFFLAASRIPFSNTKMQWQDRLPARYLMHPLEKMSVDILGLFGEPLKLSTRSRIFRDEVATNETVWVVETRIYRQFFKWISPKSCRDAYLTFSAHGGILSLHVCRHGLALLEARRISHENKISA